ncbi:MAG TPA: DUF4258 domain-containing protein [Planctomycetota bacterium]|nr:DUF4258 domain-containing protein [Planctomycetota bacterium]
MHSRQLRRFRDVVRRGEYDVTLHGLDEMEQDQLSILDLESCVSTGVIVERQRDWQTGEWKYIVHGRAVDGDEIAVVVKPLIEGKMAFLTVYRI